MKYKAHPWHGISAGKKAPELVTCFIEVVPGDEMKYEVDKESGYLMIDRPNKFSNILPALYGFIPQTYSAEACANYCMKQSGLSNIEGDGDPIDIVVLTDRKVPHGDLLLEAIPVGGFRMIDGGEADDKIVAILKGDSTYGDIKEMSDLPEKLIKRIKHYFLTYKEHPDTLGKQAPKVEITQEYGQKEAFEVITAGQKDYLTHYGQKEMAKN